MVNFNSTIFRTITDEVTGANKSIRLFGKSFAELKNIISSVKTNGLFNTNTISEADVECIKKYNNAIALNIPHQQEMEQATKGASSATAKMIKNANGNTIALDKMTLGAKAATVAMKALSVAGNMIAFGIISEGITWVYKQISGKAAEEAKQKIKELGEEAAQTIDDISDKINKLNEVNKKTTKRFAELSQGVNQLSGANKSLSSAEYEEYLNITDELIEAFPNLSYHFGDNNQKIIELSGSVEDITDKFNDLYIIQEKIAHQDIGDNLEAVYEKAKQESDQYKEEIETLTKERESAYNDMKLLSSLISGYGADFVKDEMDDRAYRLNITGVGDYSGEFKEYIKDAYVTVLQDVQQELIDEGKDSFYYNVDMSSYEPSIVITGMNEDYVSEDIAEEIQNRLSDSKYYLGNINNLFTEYKNTYEDVNQKITNTRQLEKDAWSQYRSRLISWLKTDSGLYNELSSTMQQNIQSIVNSLNWGELDLGYDDARNYIQNILNIFASDDGNEISKAFSKIFNDTNLSLNQIKAIYDELSKYFQDNPLSIKFIQDKITEDDRIRKNVVDAISASDNQGYLPAEVQNILGNVKSNRNNLDAWTSSLSRETIDLINNNLDYFTQNIDWNAENIVVEFEKVLEEVQKVAKENPIEISTAVKTIEISKKIKDDMALLTTALQDYKDNGLEKMDVSNLQSINNSEIFKTEDLEKFMSVMQDMDSTAEDVQEAFDKLATSYIYNSDLVNQITEDNMEFIASELKKNGVINSDNVAIGLLAKKYEQTGVATDKVADAYVRLDNTISNTEDATKNLNNATADEIALLFNHADATDIDRAAIISLINEKIKSNKIALTTDGDITNLKLLCKAIGATTDYLLQYERLKARIDRGDFGTSGNGRTEAQKELERLENSALRDIQAALDSQTSANTSIGGSYYSGSSSSGSSSSASETKETFDWVEVKIKRLEEEISRIDKTVSNTYKNWSARNSALSSEISKVTDEISVQKAAYDRYMQEANSVGLSEQYASKVRNGEISINTITDDNLKEKIQDYQTWYEKAIQCSDAIQDLNIRLSELAEQKFNNIQSEFESYISVINSYADIIDERISRTEEQGYFVSKKYYQALIDYENQELTKLRTEQSSLSNSLAASVASGLIEKDSEAWNEMYSKVLDVEKAIEESNTEIIKLNNNIRDLDWEIFDYILDRIDKINNEADFFISALENMKLYDDNGNFSDFGLTTASLNLVKMTTYIKMAKEYADELAKIDRDLTNDPNSKTLLERKEELIELQQEAILNSENEKQAIKSLVEEGISIHLESLSELIDKYKESMNSAKD